MALFLDLGANIGTYSVPFAANKHRVVAVDAMATNLAYVKSSVNLNGNGDLVRYIHNSLSDEKMTLYAWNRDPSNEGAMTLLNESEVSEKPADQIVGKVESVTLNQIIDLIAADTIIIKIDVEGYECKVLGPFLKDIPKKKFVPYILMEWGWIAQYQHIQNNCPDRPELLHAFQMSGYSPVNVVTLDPEGIENEANWADILWVHSSASVKKPIT